MFKKRELIQFLGDRVATFMLASLFLGVLVLAVTTLLHTKVTTQVPIRYNSFGVTNLFSDRWYSQLAFVFFGVVVSTVNGFFAVKMRSSNRGLAIGILWLSIFIFIISFIVTFYVFKLPS